MAAFDRVLSGIPEMDTAFDNIRLGDNVVWRVSDLSQFRLFMEPYVEQAIRDRRNIIYSQLFIDVYADSRNVYVRPEKVWNRNSDTMFLPYTYEPESGHFRPILDGVKSSRFYQTLAQAQRSAEEQYADSWDRFFNRTKLLHESNADITEDCGRMCNNNDVADEHLLITLG